MDHSINNYFDQLNQLGIGYTVARHPEMKTVDVVIGYFNLSRKDGASTMFVKADGIYYNFMRRDDTRLNLKKVKSILNASDCKIATAEEFTTITKLPAGANKPYVEGIPLLIDELILERDFIQSGSGEFTSGIRYNPKDILKIPNSQIRSFADLLNISSDGQNKRILSGITPSGNELHIGNYFGAVKPQIELQNQIYQTHYFVADLHALTTVKDKQVLENNIINVVVDYLSLGLNPQTTVFFRQSDVPEHSQLAVVLANYVSYGQMKRMHAFKDKLQKGADIDTVNMGLFNYPILMAADILLYQPFGVPVGEDQRQHIEITRDIAENFNHQTGTNTFVQPEPLIHTEIGRIIGTDGERKMSKSLNNYISIFQPYEIIEKQINNCYTDPNRIRATDPGKVEGNPIFIYHDLINQNLDEVADLKSRYQAGAVGDVEVKRKLTDAHKAYFASARARRDEYLAHPETINQLLKDGAIKAKQIASTTLNNVYQAIGITNKLNHV